MKHWTFLLCLFQLRQGKGTGTETNERMVWHSSIPICFNDAYTRCLVPLSKPIENTHKKRKTKQKPRAKRFSRIPYVIAAAVDDADDDHRASATWCTRAHALLEIDSQIQKLSYVCLCMESITSSVPEKYSTTCAAWHERARNDVQQTCQPTNQPSQASARGLRTFFRCWLVGWAGNGYLKVATSTFTQDTGLTFGSGIVVTGHGSSSRSGGGSNWCTGIGQSACRLAFLGLFNSNRSSSSRSGCWRFNIDSVWNIVFLVLHRDIGKWNGSDGCWFNLDLHHHFGLSWRRWWW